MSKVADLHQEYLDYLEANRPVADLEHGMDESDCDNVPMTFEDWVEYKKAQEPEVFHTRTTNNVVFDERFPTSPEEGSKAYRLVTYHETTNQYTISIPRYELYEAEYRLAEYEPSNSSRRSTDLTSGPQMSLERGPWVEVSKGIGCFPTMPQAIEEYYSH